MGYSFFLKTQIRTSQSRSPTTESGQCWASGIYGWNQQVFWEGKVPGFVLMPFTVSVIVTCSDNAWISLPLSLLSISSPTSYPAPSYRAMACPHPNATCVLCEEHLLSLDSSLIWPDSPTLTYLFVLIWRSVLQCSQASFKTPTLVSQVLRLHAPPPTKPCFGLYISLSLSFLSFF